ncbi:MAG: tetratricopeptide repeat protein [Nitrososphaera sp.]|nr:tetratricopeptide repeat protein [Nitrososphaera sp.]
MTTSDLPTSSQKLDDSDGQSNALLNLPLLLSRASIRSGELIAPLSVAELLDVLGPDIKASDIDYWIKKHILKETKRLKGKEREVRVFGRTEITKALLAAQLTHQGWSPGHIAALITLWSAGKLPGEPALPYGEMDQSGRAALILRARLLAQAVCLAYGLEEVPPDCQIVARECQSSKEEGSSIQVAKITAQQMAELHEQPELLVGWSDPTETREINTFFRTTEQFHAKLAGREFYCIRIGAGSDNRWFEIFLGIRKEAGDLETYRLRTLLKEEKPESIVCFGSEEYFLLVRLLALIFDVALKLETLHTDPNLTFRLSTVRDGTTAIANAITLVKTEWEYAALLVPDERGPLRVVAYTALLPEEMRIRNYALGTRNGRAASLPGWVFENSDEVILERIELDDPRLPQSDRFFEPNMALALIPAIVRGQTQGVLLVGGPSRSEEGRQCFNSTDIKLLYEMGRIIGETYHRAQLARHNSLLLSLPPLGLPELADNEFRDSLEDIAKMIRPVVQAGSGQDTYLVLLTVNIIGSVALSPASEISSWLLEKVRRYLHVFIEDHGHDIWKSKFASHVYRVKDGENGEVHLVGLVGRTKSDPNELKTNFRGMLDTIDKLVPSLNMKIYGWSVPFTYQDLSNRFQLTTPSQERLARMSEELIGRVKGALKVLEHITKGDGFRRQRKFHLALIEYKKAHEIDPKNPYVLRHLADCYIEIGEFEEAISSARQAVKEDPVAASYRRLANAHAARRDFKEAKENYQNAIKLTPGDAELHRLYAHTLFLDGVLNNDRKCLELAMQEYTTAKDYDTHFELHPLYLRYIAETAMLLSKLDMAEQWLLESLDLVPEDVDLQWRLRQIRNGIVLRKLTDME